MSNPSSGHSIPYHFTAAETAAFIRLHSSVDSGGQLSSDLVRYLQTGQPQWGIIVNEAYGEILVYRPTAGGKIHVVDVTNLRIAKSVKEAPFVSPGSSLLENLNNELAALTTNVLTLAQWLAIAAVAIAVIYGLSKWKR